MIGVPRKYADGAVNLFQQHDANELMRPGGSAEGELEARLVVQRRREPVVAADDEHSRRTSVVAPASKPVGERGTVEALAALVENDGDGLVGNEALERDRFLDHALADLLRAALANFDNIDVAEADAASGLVGALPVALRQ